MYKDPLRPNARAILQASKQHPCCQQLQLALCYARCGLRVHPMCPKTKRPLTAHGYKDAAIDERQIIEWWSRWPRVLVGIPTGAVSGFWVLDVDGELGRKSLQALLVHLGVEQIADLARTVVTTPSGGLHLYFRLRPGECPRSRARDIGLGIDTRGEGGTIIAPGNRLPDGRGYAVGDPYRPADELSQNVDLRDLAPAPRDLVLLATFNTRERAVIAKDSRLNCKIRSVEPSDWRAAFESHQAHNRNRFRADIASPPSEAGAMRRQALSDLENAADAYARLTDGRRTVLFTIACRVAKYTAHCVLTEHEVRSAFRGAATANGALAKYGPAWLDKTICRALDLGRNDRLPALARRFQEGGA
ncbi:MAG: bifunctional DNA primase/polymerase [Hyphomicrobiaceae bacterium]|nr:bifunctional DNA primase/polymerase [Hyphomicrobiaceae bacterium]